MAVMTQLAPSVSFFLTCLLRVPTAVTPANKCTILLFVLVVGPAFCQYQQVDVAPGEGTNPRGYSTGFTRYVHMDVEQNFLVTWDFDDDGEHITFAVYVKTRGWVGFGLSPNGGMAGSDIVIGWVKDGQAFLQDRHATGEVKPEIDEEQNYDLIEGYENNTHTVLKFRRKLETCDMNDRPIKDGTLRFIYAWGLSDPAMEDDIRYHGAKHRGSRSVKLYAEKYPDPKVPDDVIHMDFNITRYDVPAADTTYWCEAMKIPKLSRKHHVIKVEPLVERGNEAFVHHIVLLACHGDVDESYHGYTPVCRSPNMPAPLLRCNEYAFVWSVGAPDFHWPAQAGYPLWGGEEDPKFFLLEMHYDNPGLKKGISDGSGLRLILTPSLREFDSGILSLGYRYDRPYQLLPPHFPILKQYGYCPEDCLREALRDSDEGIFLFANLLHVHLYGKSVRLRHFRGAKELPLIDNDDHYDFNLQETRIIRPEVNVRPGDALVTECIYVTSQIDNIVLGGLSTSEEMCLSLAMYYPRIPLAFCESNPDIPWLMDQMSDVSVQQDNSRAPHFFVDTGPKTGQSYAQVLSDEDWRLESRRQKYQQLMDNSVYRVTCEYTSMYRSHNESLSPRRCFEEYRFPDTCGNQPVIESRCEEFEVGGAGCLFGNVFLVLILHLIILLK